MRQSIADRAIRRPLPEWRFLQLTLFMGVWMLVSSSFQQRWIVHALLHIMLLNCLLVTLWANPQWARARRVILGLWLLSLTASALPYLGLPQEWRQAGRSAELASLVPVLAACAAGILLFVFRSGRLTADGLFATVAAYLLIAFIFAQLYLLAITWAPDCFQLPVPADQRSPQGLQSDMVYFSLVTLATVGCGGILPTGDTARDVTGIQSDCLRRCSVGVWPVRRRKQRSKLATSP